YPDLSPSGYVQRQVLRSAFSARSLWDDHQPDPYRPAPCPEKPWTQGRLEKLRTTARSGAAGNGGSGRFHGRAALERVQTNERSSCSGEPAGLQRAGYAEPGSADGSGVQPEAARNALLREPSSIPAAGPREPLPGRCRPG